MTLILFYGLAAILVVAALTVVTVRNPVYAALALILSFFTAAMLWLLLRAEFLAVALVLVYVGAVMVLFMFVIMMLDLNAESKRHGFWRQLPVSAAVAMIMLVEMLLVLTNRDAVPLDILNQPTMANGSIKALGRLLYTDYFLPFQLAAVLLLVGMIAAIALTLRQRKNKRSQNPSLQVQAKASERFTLVSMPSAVKPGIDPDAASATAAPAPAGEGN